MDGQTDVRQINLIGGLVTHNPPKKCLQLRTSQQLSLNSIGQSIFELESGNGNVDRQMDKKQTNERMKLYQFRKEPSYDGDLSPCQV